jgi:hypothetical protein
MPIAFPTERALLLISDMWILHTNSGFFRLQMNVFRRIGAK